LENFDSDSLRDARLKLDKIEKEQRIKGDVSASLADSPVQVCAPELRLLLRAGSGGCDSEDRAA